MKANFNVTGSARKELVGIIGNTVGMEPVYKFMPTCAYAISNITIEKDGTMVWDEHTDAETIEKVMAALATAGFTAEVTETTETEETDTEQTEETAEVEDAEETVETAQEEGTEETVETEEAEETEQPEETTEEADETEDAVETEEDAGETEEADADSFPIDTTVSFPISQHTSTSLINLVRMIYSRGPILSKATGGEFAADKELVEALREAKLFTVQSVLDFLAEWDGSGKPLTGIEFTDGKVTFTGFTGAQDAEHVRTFTRLAAVMNKSAITQKRVLARETDMTNEK